MLEYHFYAKLLLNWLGHRELREGTLGRKEGADDPKLKGSGEAFGMMTLMTFMFLELQLDRRDDFKCSTAQ